VEESTLNELQKNKGKAVSQEEGGAIKEDKENDEFLKIMRQSEYDVVEQIKKTPTQISILTLLFNSEVHRKAL